VAPCALIFKHGRLKCGRIQRIDTAPGRAFYLEKAGVSLDLECPGDRATDVSGASGATKQPMPNTAARNAILPMEVPTSGIRAVIINFTPSWFSITMGTGILAVLLELCPYSFYGLSTIATIIFILNICIFLVFLCVTVARYVMYPFMWWRMLYHPAQSLFLGTFPMGLATIINGIVLIVVPTYGNWAVQLAWALWWLDVVISLVSCFGVPMVMFHKHLIVLEKMTAVWLLPIVPCVVAAASGAVVSTVLEPADAFITLIVSYTLWGVGMALSMCVMTIYILRLAVHNLPTSDVIVSAFLPLGPLGQGAFGIIKMGESGRRVFPAVNFMGIDGVGDIVYVISTLVGLILWGFGMWWLVHAVSSVLIRVTTSGGIEHNMGFWGFIFPLGVYTAATIALGAAIPSTFFSWLSVVFIIILVILYLYVAGGTVKGIVTGKLLVAPCLSEALKQQQAWDKEAQEAEPAPEPPASPLNGVAQV